MARVEQREIAPRPERRREFVDVESGPGHELGQQHLSRLDRHAGEIELRERRPHRNARAQVRVERAAKAERRERHRTCRRGDGDAAFSRRYAAAPRQRAPPRKQRHDGGQNVVAQQRRVDETRQRAGKPEATPHRPCAQANRPSAQVVAAITPTSVQTCPRNSHDAGSKAMQVNAIALPHVRQRNACASHASPLQNSARCSAKRPPGPAAKTFATRHASTNIGGVMPFASPCRACDHASAESNDMRPGQNAAMSSAKPQAASSHGHAASKRERVDSERMYVEHRRRVVPRERAEQRRVDARGDRGDGVVGVRHVRIDAVGDPSGECAAVGADRAR
jgi:hypothetical protein